MGAFPFFLLLVKLINFFNYLIAQYVGVFVKLIVFFREIKRMSRFSLDFFSYILLLLLRSGCFHVRFQFTGKNRVKHAENLWGLTN